MDYVAVKAHIFMSYILLFVILVTCDVYSKSYITCSMYSKSPLRCCSHPHKNG